MLTFYDAMLCIHGQLAFVNLKTLMFSGKMPWEVYTALIELVDITSG